MSERSHLYETTSLPNEKKINKFDSKIFNNSKDEFVKFCQNFDLESIKTYFLAGKENNARIYDENQNKMLNENSMKFLHFREMSNKNLLIGLITETNAIQIWKTNFNFSH